MGRRLVAVLKAQIPHFIVPFHFHNHGEGQIAHEVEQGTGEEIMTCADILIRYTKGDRPEYPEFGTSDMTFDEQPVPVEDLKAEVFAQDPRIELEVFSDPSAFDELIADVHVDVLTRGTNE